MTKHPFILIISGPTASGKTDLAEQIASKIPSQIINADVGQFYEPVSIGTAKPNWQNSPIKQHLFDVINEPNDLTIFKYYQMVLEKINYVWNLGQLPIVVGGSLFYLKSLFFPPKKIKNKISSNKVDFSMVADENLWDELNKIDSKRANVLHKNDIYRIKRALEIWLTTGIIPSEYEPEYAPVFNSMFVFVHPQKEILYERINKRTEIMLHHGWIEEAQKLCGSDWEIFLRRKGLIGYPEIFDWLHSGKKQEEYKQLVQLIQNHTRQYAKKQLTFWRSFKRQLLSCESKVDFVCQIQEIDNSNQKNADLICAKLSTIFKEN